MIRYIIVLVLSVFALGAWAQTSPPQHQHQATAATVVDGAKNPELIPDSTAYRLWLVTVSPSPNATEKERTVRQAHLNRLQLTSTADSVQLTAILTEFKSQYLSMIARYNESAKAAGSRADQKLFLQQLDDLVSTTRTAIAQRLTLEGAASINAHVRGEKSHIHLQTTGGQQ